MVALPHPPRGVPGAGRCLVKTLDQLLQVALSAYTGVEYLEAEIAAMPAPMREQWSRVVLAVLRESSALDPQKAFLAQMAATLANGFTSAMLRDTDAIDTAGIAADSIDIAREILRQIDTEEP